MIWTAGSTPESSLARHTAHGSAENQSSVLIRPQWDHSHLRGNWPRFFLDPNKSPCYAGKCSRHGRYTYRQRRRTLTNKIPTPSTWRSGGADENSAPPLARIASSIASRRTVVNECDPGFRPPPGLPLMNRPDPSRCANRFAVFSPFCVVIMDNYGTTALRTQPGPTVVYGPVEDSRNRE